MSCTPLDPYFGPTPHHMRGYIILAERQLSENISLHGWSQVQFMLKNNAHKSKHDVSVTATLLQRLITLTSWVSEFETLLEETPILNESLRRMARIIQIIYRNHQKFVPALSNQLKVMELLFLLNKSEILKLNLEDQNTRRKFLLVSKIMFCKVSRNICRRRKFFIM